MSDQHNGTGNGTGREVVPFEIDPRTAGVGTDFLMYAVGGGANIEAQVDYENDPQRSSGALPGIARSNFQNKATRQGTFVAHSLCLWISQQLQLYVPDDGNDIAWLASFTNALNQLILAAIPPGPNLGAYLPLIGGTMVGHIYFQPGITTILSNNTWYYAKDTGGTARGLILKGTDNNIYINDGTSPAVAVNGSLVINTNNLSIAGKDTGGTIRNMLGLLSDNNVHVGDGLREIYLDTGAAHAVYASGNVVIPNSFYYYSRSTEGTTRAILGISNGNSLMIGSGITGTTEIYAGGASPAINCHSQLQSLSTFVSYGYSYLTGARVYIPGGNDPLQVYADAGYYARMRFVVGGLRDWSVGVVPGSGLFYIADETGAAGRFQITTAGMASFFANVTINGAASITNGLSVAGGINISSGTLTALAATVGGGLTVYGGLNVVNGGINVTGGLGVTGNANISNGLVIYNGLNVVSGRVDFAGGCYAAGGIQCWNNLTVSSGSLAVTAGNISSSGSGSIGGGLNVYNGLTVQSGNLAAGYIISTGAAQVNNGLTVYNSINIATGGLNVAYPGVTYLRNQCQVWEHLLIQTGSIYVYNGGVVTSGNVDCGNTALIRNQAQVWNWVIIKSGGLSVEAGDMNCSSNSSIGGHVWCYNGMEVWNSITVQTGVLNVNGGSTIGGGLTVYNGFNVQTGNAAVSNGSLHVAGDVNTGNTAFIRNQCQVWNWVVIYSGGLQIHDGSGLYLYNGSGIDCSGGATFRNGVNIYNGLTVSTGNFNVNGAVGIGGGLSVWNGLAVNTGNVDFQGTLYVRNGFNVWNSMVVQSGVFTCYSDSNTSGWVRGGGLWTGGDLHSGATAYLNMCHVNQLQVGGLPWIYDRGDGMLVVPINTNFTGGIWVNGTASCGGVYCSGDVRTNWTYTNASQNYGTEYINGGCYVGGLKCYGGASIDNGLTVWNGITCYNARIYCNNDIYSEGLTYSYGMRTGAFGMECQGNHWFKGPLNGWGNSLQWTGRGGRGYDITAVGDWLYFGWNDNGQPPVVQQWMFAVNGGGIQLLAGAAYKPGGGAWADSSERRFKKDIEDYECGLDVLRQLRPRRYRFNGEDPGHPDDGKTYYGFVADEVEDIMPELVHEYDRGCVHGKVKAVDITPMFYAMLNTLKTLAARVEALEAGRA